MAGYACMYHDGDADAVHIHQTLGQPGVISVCDNCQPVYLITTLAAALGVDGGALYDVVRSYQVSVQADGEPPAAPDAADEPPMPAGPHPALLVTDGVISGWSWCACDAPGPHDQDGNAQLGDLLAQLREETCPACGEAVRGTADNIAQLVTSHLDGHQAEDQAEQEAAAQ